MISDNLADHSNKLKQNTSSDKTRLPDVKKHHYPICTNSLQWWVCTFYKTKSLYLLLNSCICIFVFIMFNLRECSIINYNSVQWFAFLSELDIIDFNKMCIPIYYDYYYSQYNQKWCAGSLLVKWRWKLFCWTKLSSCQGGRICVCQRQTRVCGQLDREVD